MSLRDASIRSNNLIESLRSTFQQISRVTKDPDPDLVQDIHESLKQYTDSLELLRQDVETFTISQRSDRRDTERARETARLSAQVARLDEDLKHARSRFRRAQLQVKRASEALRRQEREARFTALKDAYTPAGERKATTDGDLFSGRRVNTKQLTEDELLVNTSSDITAALRATHDRLTSELSRSRFAQETLEQSTAALGDLSERYTDLDSLLASSRTLLGTLVKSQKSDTWYLETAFYILIATLVWLIFRRFIYGPAWWFIWLPLKYLLFQPFAFLIRAFGGSPAGVKDLQQSLSRSATLRIQPSATDGPPKRPEGYTARPQPVGKGGYMAGADHRGQYNEETLAERIGKMAEESRQQQQQQAEKRDEAAKGERAGEARRGDGTMLEQRGDKPVNPKKRMFDTGAEDPKQGAPQAQEQQRTAGRDEL